VIVYAKKITPRLQYIADFIGKEIFGEAFQLTADSFYFNDHTGPKINYSDTQINNEELIIAPLLAGLVFFPKPLFALVNDCCFSNSAAYLLSFYQGRILLSIPSLFLQRYHLCFAASRLQFAGGNQVCS
jgi:hypothetical protein